jgi:energy-coupling factor transporter ATP-binding protein EcfA2
VDSHPVEEFPVHVEVQVVPTCLLTADRIREEVVTFLRLSRPLLPPGPCDVTAHPLLAGNVASVAVSHEACPEMLIVPTRFARLLVHVYSFSDETPDEAIVSVVPGEQTVASENVALPSRDFALLWDSLILPAKLKTWLLAYGATSLMLADHGLSGASIGLHRLLLLHGPPGSGKTSLAKALAQKLAIRHADRFPRSEFVVVNSHSLFSRFFSESGKLVRALFAQIRSVAAAGDCFVTVLIDEVESLSASRAAALAGTEPSDSVRAVNALLLELDRLRAIPSVLVICTTNLPDAVDPAFLDRADRQIHLGRPTAEARYAMLRDAVLELVACGAVSVRTGDAPPVKLPVAPAVAALRRREAELLLPSRFCLPSGGQLLALRPFSSAFLPQGAQRDPGRSLHSLRAASASASAILPGISGPLACRPAGNGSSVAFPHSLPTADNLGFALAGVARSSERLTGRSLKRLPLLALMRCCREGHTQSGIASLPSLLDALRAEADALRAEAAAQRGSSRRAFPRPSSADHGRRYKTGIKT